MPSQPSSSRGLPAHWRRGRTRAALVLSALSALLLWAGAAYGRAEKMDRWWLKARFAARESLRRPAPDPEIVLLQVDDRTAERWKDIPMIGWGGRLATVVERLRDAGARVIALDWTQPVDLERWFPGNDRRLAEAILTAGNVVMVKELVPSGDDGRPRWLLPNDTILAALASYRDLGYAEINVADAKGDSEVAALTPVLRSGPETEPSFAARVAERAAGVDAQTTDTAWTLPGKVRVPLREDGSILVNYAPGTGRGGAFLRYSLCDAAELAAGPDNPFEGKIILIGVAYTGSNDQHYVPILERAGGSRLAFGVEIQANVVRTLLSGQPIAEPGPAARWALSQGLALLGVLAFARLGWVRAQLLTAGAAVAWIGLAFGLFAARDFALPVSLPLTGLALGGSLMASYRALREELERRQVLGLWGRYQDPRLVDYLLQHPEARGGEGREAVVTVLFADLKNFTKTVETLQPGEALQMLNRYLGILSAVTLEHGGYVDKYLGDGLMAQWGAPPPDGADGGTVGANAEAAVRACLEMERQVRELSRSLAPQSGVTFGLRLSLHTGPVVVGWVGSSRLEFTIIGDTVNVTSRLQETAKELDCEFLISESTYRHVSGWTRTGKQAEVAIRGRKQPLKVYEITGLKDECEDSPAEPMQRATGEPVPAEA